jgi:predicted CXXCH cytochrome family protein
VLAPFFLLAPLALQADGAREALLALCADCHPAESAAYARTGMARALGPLRADELVGLVPVAEPGTGFTYAFEAGSGGRVVEQHAGRAGGAPWRESAPLAFAIGAGVLDRSYVLARGKRWWLAPLEVVTGAAAPHAALAPGHAIQPGTRFTLPVTPECLSCHTDAPPPRAWPLNLAPDLAAAEWTPRGISCAACHRALEAHVDFRAAELAGTESSGVDPLAVERTLGRVERMERCAACHLQGDARVELVPGRLGPPEPGTPLLATRAVFVARTPGDELGFVSHVQRLVRSRCYLESADLPAGALACETCHDPHRAVFEPEERLRVRAACLACHTGSADAPADDCALPPAERTAERDCVDCHMRKTGVFDVAEVEIHDHWIVRRPALSPSASSARKALRFPESPGADWSLFRWPDAAAPTFDTDDPGPWTMALAHAGQLERAREFLARGPGVRARRLPMLHHVRGSLYERAGDLRAARVAYEEALSLDPDLAETKTNLAPVLARLGDPRAGLELVDRLLARHPLADTARRNRAVVKLTLDDEPGARADLEAAMKLLPDPALAQALARLAEQRGDAAAAKRWTEEARRLDPRLP